MARLASNVAACEEEQQRAEPKTVERVLLDRPHNTPALSSSASKRLRGA